MDIKTTLYYFLPGIFLLLGQSATAQQHDKFEYAPRQYVCYRAAGPITVDGKLEDEEWAAAPWTATFVDIEGDIRPEPLQPTRAKMLWDDQYFYIAAELEEAHLWARLKKRDTVIFYDNDFEIFIDPDGDTHNYYELEVNALGTEWDLLLTKPYRDSGQAIDGWDIAGLKTGIQLYGTLNDPTDKDDKWAIELALPWEILEEVAPKKGQPDEGDTWRVNFSRVNWRIEADKDNGGYKKTINPKTGKTYPEYNWVWSPQGVIAMHQPETWGFVQFTDAVAGEEKVAFQPMPEDDTKWLLRQLYYAQQDYKKEHGSYADQLSSLKLPKTPRAEAAFTILHADEHLFLMSLPQGEAVWYIREDGRVWKQG